MPLEALRAWANGKHGYVAFYAQQVAVAAESCFTLCQLAQSERLFSLVNEDVLPSVWLRIYRGRVSALEKAWEAYKNYEPIPDELTVARKTAYAAWTREKGKFIVGAKKNREVEARLWRATEDWHYKNLVDEWDVGRSERFIRLNPAVAFTFRVSMPVHLLWGCSATTLYRQARLGNPESVGRLLRIDPLVIEDKQIRKHKLEILRGGGERAKILSRELSQDTSRLITLGNMKVLLAADVVKLSKAFERDLKLIAKETPGMKVGRVHLEVPEIRGLFDAIAQDILNKDEDEDLPEEDEALAKAIQRAQRFWPDY